MSLGIALGVRRLLGMLRGWLLLVAGCYDSYELEAPRLPPPAGESPSVVAAGASNSCAIVSDRSLHCWGDGRAEPRLEVPGGVLDMSNDGACLLLEGGLVDCGFATFASAALRPLDAAVVRTSLTQLCVVSNAGLLRCGPSLAELDTMFEGVRDVSVGREHACVIASGSEVRCWGSNASAQTADEGTQMVEPPGVVRSIEGRAEQISAGEEHTCVVANGRIHCWGRNAEGQLGDGRLDAHERCYDANLDVAFDCAYEPVRVAEIDDAVQVSAGLFHTCALRASGQIACWGSNAFGRLGDGFLNHGNICGDADCSPAPRRVAGIEDGRQVAAGRLHTCALEGPTGVRCWGANFTGQLGDGSFAHRSEPVVVPLLP